MRHDITPGGQTVRNHARDIAKDAAICGPAPEPASFRPLRTGEAGAVQARLLAVPFVVARSNRIGHSETACFLRKTAFTATWAFCRHIDAASRLFAPQGRRVRFAPAPGATGFKPKAQEHGKTRPLNRAGDAFIAGAVTSPALFQGNNVMVSALRLPAGSDSFTPPTC